MKIYAPNKQYTGVSASVYFAGGVGETDDAHLIAWFEAHGYGIGKELSHEKEQTQLSPPENPEVTAEATTTALTIAEIQEHLTAAGVAYPSSAKKDMLISIAEANGVAL